MRTPSLLPITLSLLTLPTLAMAQFGGGFPGGGFPGGPGGPGFPGTAPNYSVTTSSDFGAVASLGANSGFQSTATGTAVTRGLMVSATAGTARTDAARAMSTVMFARTREGAGVAISERGGVQNTDPTIGGSAGTSADAPGTTAPVQGAHSIQVAYPTLTNGAIVSIHWRGNATAGAAASASIDVDGDGTADFTATANGTAVTQLLQVNANTAGVTLAITTSGSASLAAAGSENYGAELMVLVMPGTLPTSCTFTSFGAPCGADLNGTVGSTGLDLSLDITNAPANAFGWFVAGDQATTPTPLPMGSCNLLVDGRRFFHFLLFRTDATGAASIPMRTPRAAMTISFQAIVMSLDPTTQTRTAAASNGTELVCQ